MKMRARACRLLGIVLAFGSFAYGEPDRALVDMQTAARSSIVGTVKFVKASYEAFHGDVEKAEKAVGDAVRDVREAMPEELKDVVFEGWNRDRRDRLQETIVQCRTADVRFRERMLALIKRVKEVEALTALDEETVNKLVTLANELAEECNRIKGEKWLMDARIKVRDVEVRARNYRENAIRKINLAIERRARAEAEERAAEAKARAAAEAADALKKKVEEEVEMAQAEFDRLANDIKRIDWRSCTNTLNRLQAKMTTPEGKDAVKDQLHKIEVMAGMQRHFIKYAQGFKFKNRRGEVLAVVTKVDDRSLTIQKAKYVKGKFMPDRETRVEWNRFYSLTEKEYLGYMNQFIIELVMNGRDRDKTRVGPREWSDNMLGAALTLHYLYGDMPGVDKFIPVLVTKAVKGFEPCRKWAVKWFPEVELEDPVE